MATVLIIEDDPDIREVERQALEAEGHTVEVAGDGPTGVLAAQRIKPDLIVLDVALPLFDANAVLYGLDLNPGLRGVSVIVVSANVEHLDDRARARVAKIIPKPFDLDFFLESVESALRKTTRDS
jgi:DNA-binding response OmpR family regulator